MVINCMILDDDPMVIFYFTEYIAQVPFLNLLATHQTPVDALISLETLDIHLIFMDIGMPEMSGVELARLLIETKGEAAPKIVFITGFDRFAVESYQVNALDYLVKPIAFEDFLRTTHKARRHFENYRQAEMPMGNYIPNDFVLLRVEHDIVRVYLKEIIYLESDKDYVMVYTNNDGRVIKALTTLKDLSKKLPASSFMRVHRSFIVSLDKIETIRHNTILIGRAIIPVTEQFRTQFRDFVMQKL